jgi:hypothetical protein
MSAMADRSDVMALLACTWQERPLGAPTLGDLASHIQAVRRDGDVLVVEYHPSARDALAQVIAAERRCCPGIGWQVAGDDRATLRITAMPEQLDALSQVIRRQAEGD